MTRRVLCLAGLVLTMIAALPTSSLAICAADTSPTSSTTDEAFARSDLVFVGTVTQIGLPDPSTVGTISFVVEDIWKGNVGRSVTLEYHAAEDDDVYTAQRGERWLVYAADGVAFGACGEGSRPWSDALAARRPASAHAPGDHLRAVGWVILMGSLVGIATLVAVRRRAARSAR